MKISFHGAARTVTGSKHLIHIEPDKQILLDCGLFQGMGRDTVSLNSDWGFDPKQVNAVVLSHAHIDHIGLLPKLVHDGFQGDVWCTPATADLARILMLDSARIQEADIRHVNERRAKQGRDPVEPFYTEEDAKAVLPMMKMLDYREPKEILPGVELLYTDSGHILGSAVVNLTIQENGKITRVAFSGDIGRYQHAILRSPQPFPQADVVIMESTYGDSQHGLALPAANELRKHMVQTCVEDGGKLIIPAFSVGRTQEILFQLNRLDLEKRLPDVPIYVDSPLAVEATDVIKQHPECFNKQVLETLKTDEDVFAFDSLRYIEDVEESRALVASDEPCVIISASGMAEAGRVKHHILHGLDNPRNMVLLAGYCDRNSLGGRLKAGEKEVKIFGDEHEVKCQVDAIASMSAHGDYDDLIHWLSCQENSPKIFLVHGEYEVQQAFAERLKRKGYEDVQIPEQHEVWES
jgi:metallo-beta-lactamase family protein